MCLTDRNHCRRTGPSVFGRHSGRKAKTGNAKPSTRPYTTHSRVPLTPTSPTHPQPATACRGERRTSKDPSPFSPRSLGQGSISHREATPARYAPPPSPRSTTAVPGLRRVYHSGVLPPPSTDFDPDIMPDLARWPMVLGSRRRPKRVVASRAYRFSPPSRRHVGCHPAGGGWCRARGVSGALCSASISGRRCGPLHPRLRTRPILSLGIPRRHARADGSSLSSLACDAAARRASARAGGRAGGRPHDVWHSLLLQRKPRDVEKEPTDASLTIRFCRLRRSAGINSPSSCHVGTGYFSANPD